MRTRTVMALFVAVVALAALAWWLDARGKGDRPADAPLLPRFDPFLASRVEVSKGTDIVALKAQGTTWGVVEPFERTARAGDVEAILTAIRAARRAVRSSNKESHARLGVSADVTTRVRVLDANGRALADILVGNSDRDGKTLVRIEGEDEVVAAPGEIGRLARPRAMDWVDRSLLRFDPRDVKEIAIRRPDGEAVVCARDGEAWQITAPETCAAKAGPCARIAEVLGRLDLADVAQRDADTGLDEPAFTVHVTLASGAQHEIAVGKEAPSGRYARVGGPVVIASRLAQDLDKRLADLKEEAASR